MSNKYIHYDLHRLIEKYFDTKDIDPIETENYQRCFTEPNIHDHDLYDECIRQGNLNFINYFFDKDDNFNNIYRINWGLEYVCRIEKIELIDFFIKKGAYWHCGIYGACGKKNLKMAKIIIEKAGDKLDIDCALEFAYDMDRDIYPDIYDLLLSIKK